MPCPKHPNRELRPWEHDTKLKCTAKIGQGPDGKAIYCDHEEPMTREAAQKIGSPEQAPARALTTPAPPPEMPEWLKAPLAQYVGNPAFELMLPSVPVNASIGYGHRVAVSVVQISADPNDREVFKVGVRDGRDVYAYSKQGLEKFAEAAGIQIKTTRVDDRRDPDYCEIQALGAMKGSNGQPIIRTATKAFRMPDVEAEAVRTRMKMRNEDEATARKNVAGEMSSFRKHLLARTESGAVLRVFRSLLAIKSGLTAEQVARPKVLARVEFNPDPKGNPVVERFLLEKGYAATTALFGTDQPSVGADVRDVTDEQEEDAGVDYGVDQSAIQLGNAPTEDAGKDYLSQALEGMRALGLSTPEQGDMMRQHGNDYQALYEAVVRRANEGGAR